MKTEYISREAAIEKITALINKSGKYTDYECGVDDACYIVEHDLPATDVVEVVRCMDCINWNGNDCLTMYGLFAAKPNNYCSRGVRRDPNGKTT